MTAPPQERTLFDFSSPGSASKWHSIDDRIMGGCSQSQPEHSADAGMRFHGTVSLANNGGFASIRSATTAADLGGYSGLRLRLRGDGKTYKISLRTDCFFDGISYQAEFATRAGTWQEVDLPFTCFTPTHHGITLSTVAPLDPAQVQSFGLFIADRQEGPFRLDLAWIKAV